MYSSASDWSLLNDAAEAQAADSTNANSSSPNGNNPFKARSIQRHCSLNDIGQLRVADRDAEAENLDYEIIKLKRPLRRAYSVNNIDELKASSAIPFIKKEEVDETSFELVNEIEDGVSWVESDASSDIQVYRGPSDDLSDKVKSWLNRHYKTGEGVNSSGDTVLEADKSEENNASENMNTGLTELKEENHQLRIDKIAAGIVSDAITGAIGKIHQEDKAKLTAESEQIMAKNRQLEKELKRARGSYEVLRKEHLYLCDRFNSKIAELKGEGGKVDKLENEINDLRQQIAFDLNDKEQLREKVEYKDKGLRVFSNPKMSLMKT